MWKTIADNYQPCYTVAMLTAFATTFTTIHGIMFTDIALGLIICVLMIANIVIYQYVDTKIFAVWVNEKVRKNSKKAHQAHLDKLDKVTNRIDRAGWGSTITIGAMIGGAIAYTATGIGSGVIAGALISTIIYGIVGYALVVTKDQWYNAEQTTKPTSND